MFTFLFLLGLLKFMSFLLTPLELFIMSDTKERSICLKVVRAMKQIINVLQQKGVIMYKNGNFSLSYITQSIVYLLRFDLKLRLVEW